MTPFLRIYKGFRLQVSEAELPSVYAFLHELCPYHVQKIEKDHDQNNSSGYILAFPCDEPGMELTSFRKLENTPFTVTLRYNAGKYYPLLEDENPYFLSPKEQEEQEKKVYSIMVTLDQIGKDWFLFIADDIQDIRPSNVGFLDDINLKLSLEQNKYSKGCLTDLFYKIASVHPIYQKFVDLEDRVLQYECFVAIHQE